MEIKKVIFFLVSLVLIHCAVTNETAHTRQSSALDLHYVIEPVSTDTALSFNVNMYFKGNARGEDKIVIPSQWAGQKNLQKYISNLEVLTPEAQLHSTELKNIKKITHNPNQMLHVRYHVTDFSLKGLSVIQGIFVHKFRPEYFHFFGSTFFIHPYWDISKKIKIALDWTKLPGNWQVSNSFGTNVRSQIVIQSLYNFKYALFVGGDYRTYKIVVSNNPVYIAIRGEWPFKDQEALDLLTKIVTTQRNFWQDHDYPYFLITLSPTETTCCRYVGAAAFKGFTLTASQKEINKYFINILNHEFFHNWLGSIINRQSSEELTYWFIEGFSDYYARLFSLREGLISLKDYLDDLNKLLRNYHTSAVKGLHNSEVSWNFWHDQSMNKMPYYKGDIMAHVWNDQILRSSTGKQSLDTFMHDLLMKAKSGEFPVSNKNVADLLKKYLSGNPANDIQRYIESGQLIDMQPSSLGPCVFLERGAIPQYKINFETYQKNPQLCLSYFGI